MAMICVMGLYFNQIYIYTCTEEQTIITQHWDMYNSLNWRYLYIGISLIVLLGACKHEPITNIAPLDDLLMSELEQVSPTGSLEYYILPMSSSLSQIPQDPKNPLNPAKVTLGKMLFFETGMAIEPRHPSGLGTYSCATCHTPEAGFRVGRVQGIADGGIGFGLAGDQRLMHDDYEVHELDVQGIRPLSVLNVCEVTNTMWAGSFGAEGSNVGTEDRWTGDFSNNFSGYKALEAQNFVGMKTHRLNMTPEMAEAFGYTQLFNDAFPDFPENDRINRLTASLAISAYLRTLNTTEAPFQRWVRGFMDEMTPAQKRGAILFFAKANCARCHNEPNLGSNTFHALGVNDLYNCTEAVGTGPFEERNKGRGLFTLEQQDLFRFRVPQLYNLKDAPVYFHGSSKTTLEEVIAYKCAAVSENPNVPDELLSPFFQPLDLTEQERSDLLEFIRDGLYDPNIQRFVPSAIGSGNCFPNNDPISRAELGCE